MNRFKILDFTSLLPGPFTTMYLADMGAEVLKIISPHTIDMIDSFPPFIKEEDHSAAFLQLNRNKKMAVLDLKTKAAQAKVYELIKDYDIVIEQYRPGVMKRLGIDYETLSRINPSIIYCSITGYGQTSSLKNRPGHDINYVARSGIGSISGTKQSGPLLAGLQMGDIIGGYNATIGVLAAVIERDKSGMGQYIDISMTDCLMASNPIFSANYLYDGKPQGFEENVLNGGSVYGFHKTSDDQFMSVGCLEPKFIRNFCETIGRMDLFQNMVDSENIDFIKSEITEIFASKTKEEWTRAFEDAEACVEPVLSIKEVLDFSEVGDNGLLVELDTKKGRVINQLANPIKSSLNVYEYHLPAMVDL